MGFPWTSITEQFGSFLFGMEDMQEINKLEDLPIAIVALLQDQKGLQINSKPISSRQDLERVLFLLHSFIPDHILSQAKTLELTKLVLLVFCAYGKMISRNRKFHTDKLLILRDPPYDVLARKCSGCGQEVLDDPFPYWSKHEPDVYVSWAVRGGCGNTQCNYSYASLKPTDQHVKWSAANTDRISQDSREDAESRRLGKSSIWLLRDAKELGTLLKEVELKCPFCLQTKILKAKWTISPEAALLVPYLLCSTADDSTQRGCGKRGNWLPLARFPIIRQPNLVRVWKGFSRRGCILSEYPRDGGVIFAKETYSFRIAKLKELKSSKKEMGPSPGSNRGPRAVLLWVNPKRESY